jgi:hypothetical protein
MPHAFFASYATSDNATTFLRKAVTDLRERVRSKLGALHAEDVGFFAVFDGIRAAEDWQQALGDSVRQARVIVCFCSSSYFNSEYCAKEFEIFRRRLAAVPGSSVDVILPVIWEPCSIPRAIARYQTAHESAFPKSYRQQGLHAVMRNKTARATREATLNALTETIVRLAERPPLRPLDPPIIFNDLVDVFDFPGAYSVRFGAVHKDGLRWMLVPELGRTVARVAEEVTAALRVSWSALRMRDDLAEQLADSARLEEALIFFGDAKQLTEGAEALRAKIVDDACLPNCVFLVGVDDITRGPANLATVLPKLSAKSQVVAFPISEIEALKKRLETHIVKLRLTLLSAGTGTTVVDPALAEEARRDGIVVATPPIVSGPGSLNSLGGSP